jgi:predicted porin
MKKKLLMAAVGAALVAGPTVAVHAATTLYGHMHMSYDRMDNDNNQENGILANNSSRFGIKGSEDVGGGLKAIYQVESGTFQADDGSNGFGGTLRNTFVGFSGGWGTVKIGRHDTPFKEIGRKLDDFNEQFGDARSLIGMQGTNSGAVPALFGTFDNRVSNMIRYDTPKFGGGFNASIMQTSNSSSSDGFTNSGQKENSLKVEYASGPIWVGLGWVEQGAGSTNDPTAIRLSGSYTFNDIELGLLWETMSDLGGTSGADRDSMGFFASYKMGNNKLKLNYVKLDEIDNAANTGADMIAIGVNHSMSKTVTLYANYATTSNDPNAAFSIVSNAVGHDGNALAPAAGKDMTGYTLGTIIKF